MGCLWQCANAGCIDACWVTRTGGGGQTKVKRFWILVSLAAGFDRSTRRWFHCKISIRLRKLTSLEMRIRSEMLNIRRKSTEMKARRPAYMDKL